MSENPTTVRQIFKFITPASIVFGIALGTVYAQWFGNSGIGRFVSALFCLMLGLLGAGLFYVALDKWFSPAPLWQKLLVSCVFVVSEAAPTSAVFLALQEIVAGEGVVSAKVDSRERGWKETLAEMESRLDALRSEIPPDLREQRERIDRTRIEINELVAETTLMDNDGDKTNDHMIAANLARTESLKADLANLMSGEAALIERRAQEYADFAAKIEDHRQRREALYAEKSAAAEERHPFVTLSERMAAIPGWKLDADQTLLAIIIFWTLVIQWLPYGAVFGLRVHGAIEKEEDRAPVQDRVPRVARGERAVLMAPETDIFAEVSTELAWMNIEELRRFVTQLGRQNVIARINTRGMRKNDCYSILAQNWRVVEPFAKEAKNARSGKPHNVTELFSMAS